MTFLHTHRYIYIDRYKSYVSVSLAFRGYCWVSGSVGTVIINGVFTSNPAQTTPLKMVEILEVFLIPPPFSLRVTQLCVHGCFTTVDVESLVRCHERRFWPIRLLQSAPCCPVVRVPQTRVQFHRLIKWEFHPQIFAIFEYSYRYVVH